MISSTFFIDSSFLDEHNNAKMNEITPLLATDNSLIYISIELTFLANATIGANSVLVFENGAMIKANSEVTLTGNNTTIEAPLVQIFGDNVHLGGSYLNAEWPIEWWGAISDSATDMSGFINRALQEIAATGKQGTLLLTGRYEVHDTIYMQPGVAISGAARTFSYRYYPLSIKETRGTLLINFSDPNKWVIDTPYINGGTIDFNVLSAFDDEEYKNHFSSKYTGCNIRDLHIADKVTSGVQHVFGGIRIHGMHSGLIENVDLEAHVFIGLALVAGVWTTSLNNLFLRAVGCPLYMGRSNTVLSANNVTCRVWNETNTGPFRMVQPANVQNPVAPVMQEHTLPPYWKREYMNSCGIIMEGAHCTFTGCTIELVDAVICGTDYIARFIQPYIENIHYTFGWLFATTTYSIPDHRYELLVEDMISGFNTFPSMEKKKNDDIVLEEYKHQVWNTVATEDIPEGVTVPEGDTLKRFNNFPTFGTVRGVIRAHNVGRATCWENKDSIYEGEGENQQLVTWNYPSYFIHMNQGIVQHDFYYDDYALYRVWHPDPNHPDDMIPKGASLLLAPQRSKHKEIIIEHDTAMPLRYYYHDTDIGGGGEGVATSDLAKRQLHVGITRNTATLSGELFARGLDNFIMTPAYFDSAVDYDGMVISKSFTFEIINNARTIKISHPLRLHDCKVTFRNTHTLTAILDRSDFFDVLHISGNCTFTFEGDFLVGVGVLTHLFFLVGIAPVNITVNLFCDNYPQQDGNHYNLLSLFTDDMRFIANRNAFAASCNIVINKLESDGTITQRQLSL